MAIIGIPETIAKPEETEVPAQDMEIVARDGDAETVNGEREREEASIEEQLLEKKPDEEDNSVSERRKVTLGLKSFVSSVEMFDYFFKFLHSWAPNLDVNKYEHTMLLELLKNGHPEPDKKIGPGIRAFQVKIHPQFKNRCFFIVRVDESEDDFSFRKCVNQILPLPAENMQFKNYVNHKPLTRERGGKGGYRRGRGGRPRN